MAEMTPQEIEALVGRHSYDSPRTLLQTSTSVSSILSKYPCDSKVAGNANLRLYYGGEGKHRRERQDGEYCCGGGGNWGHEWNCDRIKLNVSEYRPPGNECPCGGKGGVDCPEMTML